MYPVLTEADDDKIGFDAYEDVSSSTDESAVEAAVGEAGEEAAGSQGAAKDSAPPGGKWRPQVVVPLAGADVGLQEPKFLKINTPEHSEL